MLDAAQIQEITSQYAKHGWSLSRVLLSAPTREKLSASLEKLFGDAEIVSSELDAVWFSRVANPNRQTWELRRLSGSPFALVEVFDDEDDEEIREETRQEMQTRMLESASKNTNRQFSR